MILTAPSVNFLRSSPRRQAAESQTSALLLASTGGSLLSRVSQRASVAQSPALLNYDRSSRISLATPAIFSKTKAAGGHSHCDVTPIGNKVTPNFRTLQNKQDVNAPMFECLLRNRKDDPKSWH